MTEIEIEIEADFNPELLVWILMDHYQMGFAPKCRCGWKSSFSLNDTNSDRQQWAWHIADTFLGASR